MLHYAVVFLVIALIAAVFGFGGIAKGAEANDLIALVEDPNSRIHEGKSFTGNVQLARRGVTR